MEVVTLQVLIPDGWNTIEEAYGVVTPPLSGVGLQFGLREP